MSILNASIFGVVAALIVGGADYAMAMKKHVGQEYSLIDHIEFRIGDVMAGSGVAKALPRAPSGWDVRKGTVEDNMRLSGVPLEPEKVAAITAQNEKIVTAIPGMQTEDRLYQKGEAEIFLDITFVPANMKEAKLVRLMSQLLSALDSKATDVANSNAGALALRKYSGPETGKATVYYYQQDGQIFISALSTASEEQTIDLLAGIDKGALQMLVIDDPTIGKAPGGVVDEGSEAEVTCVQKGAAKFCSANN